MVPKLALLFLFTGFTMVVTAQSTPVSADTILARAFSKAKKEKKNVFIIFHASWCGWCRKMDAAMSDPACKPFFDANYIVEHLTILESKDKRQLENQGAEALFKKYAPADSGIPFWLIYDAKGTLIADAKMPDGSNAGCPATADEVAHLIHTLKRSSSIGEETSKAIFERFRRNESVKQGY
ncbi:thioredoxin family protein [Niabella yanshanensis]|uniref:Thioredoxin family protein n=1 Tax=Niabella yanshanensis TaxID=577386 RepID=A0ABZ0W3Q4_9BACT|nr:thioredoxin family protein [Niabella yanshanensis]WQD37258.1 thioredoxin family protein [Niabella yanshanensis]